MTEPRQPLTRTAAKFLVVGASNNAAMYALFVGQSFAGMNAIVAATITYALGMVISFVLHERWTFRHSGNRRRTIVRFLIANLGGYLLNVAILWVFVSRLGLPQIAVQLFALGVVAIALFFTMRGWVFRAAE